MWTGEGMLPPTASLNREEVEDTEPAPTRTSQFGAVSAILGRAPQVAVSDGLSGSDHTQALKTRP